MITELIVFIAGVMMIIGGIYLMSEAVPRKMFLLVVVGAPFVSAGVFFAASAAFEIFMGV